MRTSEATVDERNAETSRAEVAAFIASPPTSYLLYIDEARKLATTSTGDKLGYVSFGREYRSPGFVRGSVRVPVRISAVNGRTYFGTYYKSAGSYARVKIVKS